MAGQPRANIDPHLLRQLSGTKPVKATFTLRLKNGSALRPDQTRDVVKALMARVAKETNAEPGDLNVYPLVQSFAVRAPVSFVRKLVDSPEIGSAISNEQPDNDLMIHPVNDTPVLLETPAERKGSAAARAKAQARRRSK